jgi:hypothetical protein
LDKVYEGYINPHYKPCPENEKTCFSGWTAAGKWLDGIARFLVMVGNEAAVAPYAEEFKARRRTYPHPFLEEFCQAPRTSIPRAVELQLREIKDKGERNRAFERTFREHPPKLLPLTSELQGLIEGLIGEPCRGELGHGLDWALQKRLKEFAGITDEKWGVCPVCKGEGLDPAAKAAYDAWKSYDPPKGPGFQLWTTTNEGAPISPVFETLDALCAYLEPNVSVFGYEKTMKEKWKEMLEADFVHHAVDMPDGSKAVFM